MSQDSSGADPDPRKAWRPTWTRKRTSWGAITAEQRRQKLEKAHAAERAARALLGPQPRNRMKKSSARRAIEELARREGWTIEPE